jgi:hypothetical protein
MSIALLLAARGGKARPLYHRLFSDTLRSGESEKLKVKSEK